MMLTILAIFIIITIVAALPVWHHSRKFGYFPSTAGAVVVLAIIVLMFRSH